MYCFNKGGGFFVCLFVCFCCMCVCAGEVFVCFFVCLFVCLNVKLQPWRVSSTAERETRPRQNGMLSSYFHTFKNTI